jgi:hypothetical protein
MMIYILNGEEVARNTGAYKASKKVYLQNLEKNSDRYSIAELIYWNCSGFSDERL